MLAAAVGIAVLAGCATGAKELPPYVAQSTEYTPPTSPRGPAALPTLRISRPIWETLSTAEQARIKTKHDVSVLEEDQYGVILDAQGQDQSTPGTMGGATLGESVANAAYIDHALKGGSYSAKNQLAIGIVGAVIGSSLDAKPITQYQFRYTVKQGDGEIKYFDEVKSTPFRHSVGVCVTLPELTLVTQQLCQQTEASVRQRYLK